MRTVEGTALPDFCARNMDAATANYRITLYLTSSSDT
jgi:hypothetical protein